jgi:CRP-like cAMP-binding protein
MAPPLSRAAGRLPATPASIAGLPPELWTALLGKAQTVLAERRQTLFSAGDEGEGCYVVQSGALKAVLISAEGHERMLAVFGPGSIVGEMALFDDQPRSATVIAIRESKLAYLSKDVFFRFADQHPEVYRHALRILASRLRGTTEDAMAQTVASVASRVAKAFLQLSDSLGESIDGERRRIAQRVTQSDIAAMAGVARENASRAINQWIRQRVLSRAGGYYIIENRRRLAEQAEA